MSTLRQLFTGALSVSGATLLARVGTFLGNVAVIRLLGGESLGRLGLIEAWLGVAALFSLVGISLAANRNISCSVDRDPARAGRIAGTALMLGCALGSGVGAITYAGLSSFPNSSPTVLVLAEHRAVFALLIIAVTLRQIVADVLYGLASFNSFVRTNAVLGLLSFPALYSFVYWRGVEGAVEARLLLTVVEVGLLGFAARAALARLGTRFSFHGAGDEARALIALGFPSFVGQLIANPVQPIMLSIIAARPGGLQQVGLFTAAMRLQSFASFGPGTMSSLLVPILSRAWAAPETSRFRESATLTLRALWMVNFPIILFCLAASQLLLGGLYGGEFRSAWPIAFALLVALLLSVVNETADRILVASGRVWLSTINNFCWVLALIPLAAWLIPEYGALGYAIAHMAAFAGYVGLQLWWIQRLFAVHIRPLSALFVVAIPLLAAAGWIAASLPVLAGVGAALALALVGLAIEVVFFLTAAERQALLRWCSRVAGRFIPRRIRVLHDREVR